MTNLPTCIVCRAAVCAVLMFGVRSPASAQAVPRDTERQILAARDSIWHAWFAHDTAVLSRMLPRGSTAAEPGGGEGIRWADRAEILAGSKQFAATGGRLDHIDFANTRISLDGGVAIVTSNYTAVTRSTRGADTTRGHAIELFVRDGDRWLNPFWRLEPRGSASSNREIPLPDTLGANFAIADSASRSGTPEDYDAFLGFWEFRFQFRNPDGTFAPAFAGHWSFEKKPGAMLIEDHWRADNPMQPMGLSTYTYRTFHPQRKIWQMLGTNSAGGEFALGLTWSDDENRFAIQRYGNAIMRIRYLAIEPNRFLWRADRSVDGGKTWLRDAWMMEATRIGK